MLRIDGRVFSMSIARGRQHGSALTTASQELSSKRTARELTHVTLCAVCPIEDPRGFHNPGCRVI
jgi:hypothetical protein